LSTRSGTSRRYGRTFEQFAADTNAGRIVARFARRTKHDFMDWVAIAMERQERLDFIRELTAPADAAG
jgi:hypothetical protein